ncbi:MAG: hypothetical protein F6K11_17195 [Leptolyngbya sp. SIO3F4]|nr:hypothetical protein [Leptolyngbya sp. SIO3F4]
MPRERALIEALATRYVADPNIERDALDQAYAQAMQEVHRQYPDDLDIAVLYAEALMDTMPWNYWDEDGNPDPKTERLLSTLESVMARDPKNIGALHLYIHAVEKEHPALAEAAADTLGPLVPGSGHLVHMPSHIYIRIGRYRDAVVANQQAIAADNGYQRETQVAPNIYTLAYMPHNYHFEWFAALMGGQSELALDAADHTAQVDETMLQDPDFAGALQHYYSVPLFTLIRFERWDDILATPAPDEGLKYPVGIWHYAQGMALAAQEKTAQAREHLTMLQTLVDDPSLTEQKIWGLNATNDIIHIATSVLAGEIAQAEGDSEQAIALLQQAVDLEKQLVYNEPPDWYSPTQNLLGQVLLKSGHYDAAETAFLSDLDAYPQNGWSLYGLAESLEAQGKTSAAATIRKQYEAAWKYADTSLEMST